MELDQYRFILVNLDPTVGSEIQKTSPCVIISPDEINFNIKTITIAPMTSKSHPYPTRTLIHHNNQGSWVILDQIRTIDKKRVIKSFDRLTDLEISEVKRIIKETFVD